MIKFLGHTIITDDNVECFDDEPAVFAPREAGESCLMTGPNERDYGTYLEQKNFLENVYNLMMQEK